MPPLRLFGSTYFRLFMVFPRVCALFSTGFPPRGSFIRLYTQAGRLAGFNFTFHECNDTIGERAEVAQLVEQLIRNQQVVGSSPTFGSISIPGS